MFGTASGPQYDTSFKFVTLRGTAFSEVLLGFAIWPDSGVASMSDFGRRRTAAGRGISGINRDTQDQLTGYNRLLLDHVRRSNPCAMSCSYCFPRLLGKGPGVEGFRLEPPLRASR